MAAAPLKHKLKRIAHFGADVALELLWPTRCAVCDAQGESVLCKTCASQLRFIDACHACPVCGAPYGRIQCTECNEVMLHSLGMEAFPLDGMASALVLDDAAKRIVAVYKDLGERRLREVIASTMARYVSPDRMRDGSVLSYIPDTSAAMRRRGFDHARELAQTLAGLCGLECVRLFERPASLDQRTLGRSERIENMRQAIKPRGELVRGGRVPGSVLLIDDVCTTGSTLYAAAAALKDCGVEHAYALTFGRVLG